MANYDQETREFAKEQEKRIVFFNNREHHEDDDKRGEGRDPYRRDYWL